MNLELYVPPNCGITGLLWIIAELTINYDILANFNKYSQFPFQDAISRNVLLFDEPVLNSPLKRLYLIFQCINSYFILFLLISLLNEIASTLAVY